jgi:hypothetical protein
MWYALPQQLMRAGLPKGGTYQVASVQVRKSWAYHCNYFEKYDLLSCTLCEINIGKPNAQERAQGVT